MAVERAQPIIAPDTSDLNLGTFIVGSTTELDSPPVATVIYVGTLDGGGGSITQGTVSINSIPEPSSVILLLMGAVALPVVMLRERQRQQIAA